jgi:hypothetical protein
MPDEGAGIDFCYDGDRKAFEIFIRDLFGSPVRADGRKLTRSQPFNKRARGFIVSEVGAVVPYLWIGKNNDLARIGGVGKDFLIASERCIENYFARAFPFSPVAFTAEDAPVFERKHCLHRFSKEWIQVILSVL